MTGDDTVTTLRRTRVRPGMAEVYARTHAAIPDAIAQALRECGVVAWRIFADGDTLLHVVGTRDGYSRMVTAMTALGPIDPVWDHRIAGLLEPVVDDVLPLVWAMDETGQYAGGGAPGVAL